MKRKLAVLLLSGMMAFSLAACGAENPPQSGQGEENTDSWETQDSESGEAGSAGDTGTDAPVNTEESQADSGQSLGGHVLIAYFTAAENSGVDVDASASYSIVDGEAKGRLKAIADMIQEQTGGELFSIQTDVVYPADGGELIDYASEEQAEDARPELTSHIEDLDGYDVVFVGFPKLVGGYAPGIVQLF